MTPPSSSHSHKIWKTSCLHSMTDSDIADRQDIYYRRFGLGIRADLSRKKRQTSEEKSKHQSSYKLFDLQRWPVCTICWYSSDIKVVGVTIHYLKRFKTDSMGWNPWLTLLPWPRIWDEVGHGLRGNPNIVTLLKEHNNITTPNDILLQS